MPMLELITERRFRTEGESALDAVRERLHQAQHVVVLTGAGMSQESGLPTYRSSTDGLWNQHIMEEVATQSAWRADPRKVWVWHRELSREITSAQPNAGHVALARLESLCKVTVVTQNVDDLHERAGSTQVVHLHGSAFAWKCSACARQMTLPDELADHWEALRVQVRCPSCQGHIRPDVVWFGEMLAQGNFSNVRMAIRNCDLVLVVGTSGKVLPAAELPRYAMKRKKFVAEVNPDGAVSGWVSARIRGTAAEVLPLLM